MINLCYDLNRRSNYVKRRSTVDNNMIYKSTNDQEYLTVRSPQKKIMGCLWIPSLTCCGICQGRPWAPIYFWEKTLGGDGGVKQKQRMDERTAVQAPRLICSWAMYRNDIVYTTATYRAFLLFWWLSRFLALLVAAAVFSCFWWLPWC